MNVAMPKKKKNYHANRRDWDDVETERKNKKMIREKERKMKRKYKQGWDSESLQWREGFSEDG